MLVQYQHSETPRCVGRSERRTVATAIIDAFRRRIVKVELWGEVAAMFLSPALFPVLLNPALRPFRPLLPTSAR